MRIIFQCDRCATAYTMQMPDGIGTVGVAVTCPCGNVVQHEFHVPRVDETGLVRVMVQETVKSNTRMGG